MVARKPHPFDSVSDEIMNWLENESKYYVSAMVGDYQSPFAAQVSEKDKLDYYRRKVYNINPDGTPNYDQPNKEGRDTLIKQVGIEGFADIMKAVGPRTTLADLDPGNTMGENDD